MLPALKKVADLEPATPPIPFSTGLKGQDTQDHTRAALLLPFGMPYLKANRMPASKKISTLRILREISINARQTQRSRNERAGDTARF